MMSEYSSDIVAYCKQIQEIYGWKMFNFHDGKWRFSDPSIARLVKNRYPHAEVSPTIFQQAEYEALEKARNDEKTRIAEELKQTMDSELEVKNVKHQPYPYQKVAVEFFINNNGRAILADTMGTGKTLQSLAYVAHTEKRRTLVICPASVKYSWEKEVKKWTHLKSYVVVSQTKLEDIPFDTNVVIINYDQLKKHFNWLDQVQWDAMIVDECHYVKNSTAQRTKAVKYLAKKISSTILMSGTPMLSRPLELFNALQMMDPKTWNNYYDYTRRYCDGKQTYWGWEAKGATNVEELEKRISRYFLRRTKDQVLKDLPRKVFVDVPVDMPREKIQEYKMASKELAQYLRDVKKQKGAEIAKSLQAEKLVKMNYLRQITSWGKMDTAIELVEDIVASGQKVLVFSTWNDTLEELHRVFGDSSVMITGKTPIPKRKDAIDSFQEDPDVKIFLGGMLSAGVGITLTAATAAVFLDYSWNPADHAQAIDRMHRPGATAESVTIYQLYSRGTIDDTMQKILSHKQKIFDKLINGGEEEQMKFTHSFAEEVFDQIKGEL